MKTQSFSPIGRIFGIALAVFGVIVSLIPLRPQIMFAIWNSSSAWIIHLVVGGACLRAGYLAYFRWSPLAVQHVVGTLFFFLTVASWHLEPVAGLYCLPIFYLAYRLAAAGISRLAFPSPQAKCST